MKQTFFSFVFFFQNLILVHFLFPFRSGRGGQGDFAFSAHRQRERENPSF